MKPAIQLYLAPFQGITSHTFRRVYARYFHNVTKYYTPFFAKIDHESRISARKSNELQHLTSSTAEVVPQILSKDAAEILRFANICASLGFEELNWNLGCPYPQVADKKRGSGMLPFPDMIDAILDKVMPSIPIRFSIKCRLGYATPDEFYALIPLFNAYPIHELTVHPRVGKQLYSGETNKEFLLQVLPLVKIPFVYNGDILTVDDFNRLVSMMPNIERWMIGRGILGNPFLSDEIYNSDNLYNRKVYLQKFMDELYYGYRSDMSDRLTLLNVLKEYWDYLFTWFDNHEKVKRIIKKVRTFDEYEDAVKRIFEEFDESKPMIFPTTSHLPTP